jgi:hypothetical protein
MRSQELEERSELLCKPTKGLGVKGVDGGWLLVTSKGFISKLKAS